MRRKDTRFRKRRQVLFLNCGYKSDDSYIPLSEVFILKISNGSTILFVCGPLSPILRGGDEMKKNVSVILTLFLITSVPIASFAAEIKDGGSDKAGEKKTWSISFGMIASYAWWTPVWLKYSFWNGIPHEGYPPFSFKIKPSFIYGPLVGVSFNPKWGLSGSFAYAKYKSTATIYYIDNFATATVMPLRGTRDAVKMDSDLLVNYNIDKYVKIFFGPKYQGYQYNEETLLSKTKIAYNSCSLGFGSGFNVPIVSTFYFQPNVSLFGLYGLEIRTGSEHYTSSAYALGFNGVVAFAYFIPAAHLTFTVGYKAQYIHYFQKTNSRFVNDYDLFHGALVSVVATF